MLSPDRGQAPRSLETDPSDAPQPSDRPVVDRDVAGPAAAEPRRVEDAVRRFRVGVEGRRDRLARQVIAPLEGRPRQAEAYVARAGEVEQAQGCLAAERYWDEARWAIMTYAW